MKLINHLPLMENNRMRHFLAIALLGFAAPAAAMAGAQATFYVAPDGSDNNSGTETKPFATIEKARQTVRTINKSMTGDIVVVLRGGVYSIEHPILFDRSRFRDERP